MGIQETIEQVLRTRQEAKTKVEELIQIWTEAENELRNFEKNYRDDSIEIPQEINAKLSDAGIFNELQEDIGDVIVQLRKAYNRFSRTTINIGIAGLAGQGKSRFLQSVTGLSDKHIPTSDIGFCTVTKSTIEHDTESFATVHFFSERDFILQELVPYYEEFGVRSETPRSLNDFKNNPLPEEIEEDISKTTFFTNLEDLRESVNTYKDFIGKPPKRITLDEIEFYVSRNDSKKYYAVECAEIHAPFPMSEVNKLKLVDLPGLGEHIPGASDKLIASLENEVDVVIIIRRPDQKRGHWITEDLKAIDSIVKTIQEIPSEKWLFLALNQLSNKANEKQIEHLNSVAKGHKKLKNYNIYVVDASSQESVHNDVLQPVLSYLSENLEKMDEEYIEFISNFREKVKEGVRKFISNMELSIKDASLDQHERPLFREKFDELYGKMIGKIEDLVNEYKDLVNVEDHIEENLNKVLEAAKQVPPLSKEEIIHIRNEEGAWVSAYIRGLHACRVEMTQRLAQIDDFLTTEIDTLHKKVLDEFKNIGLGRITQNFDWEFFKKILEESQHILEATNALLQFNLSYKGIFHYRIREQMEAITPGHIQEQEYPFVEIGNESKEKYVEYIQRLLKTAFDGVLYKVEKALQAEQSLSNKALFAVIEQFHDDIFRKKGIKGQWDALFFKYRYQIWPKDFSSLASENQRIDVWNRNLEDVKKQTKKLK